MKRLFVALAMLFLSACIYAQDVEHWTKIGESQSDVFWYAYSIERIGCIGSGNVDNRCATVNVALKDATKSLGNGYSALSILRGSVICNSYDLPQDIFNANVSTFNVHSIPMREIMNEDIGYKTALQRGTALADAVTSACNSVNIALTKTGLPATSPLSSLHASVPMPAPGKCSTPKPSYPPQAIRLHQQGIVTIGADVVDGGHVANLSVQASSGSAPLDREALSISSLAICNAQAGSHVTIPITFNLNTL